MKLFRSLRPIPPIPKRLSHAICGLMAMAGLGMSADASDIEIYQSSKNGKITVMLLLDISGSMNLPNSMISDYHLRSGDRPQDANGNGSLPTPILDELKRLNPTAFDTGEKDNKGNPIYEENTHTAVGNGNSRYRYSKRSLDKVTNFGTYTKAQAEAELTDYLSFSPSSWCQTASAIPFANKFNIKRPAGWEETLITETVPNRGYTRQYCRIPTNISLVEAKYWQNNDIRNSTTIPNKTIGCEEFDGPAGKEYRCYSRIARLKDALWDIVNGNKAKGIEPLGDNIHLGIATLGIRTKYQAGVPWAPDAP